METIKRAEGEHTFLFTDDDPEGQAVMKKLQEKEVGQICIHVYRPTEKGVVCKVDTSKLIHRVPPDYFQAALLASMETLVTDIAMDFGVPPSNLAGGMAIRLGLEERVQAAKEAEK